MQRQGAVGDDDNSATGRPAAAERREARPSAGAPAHERAPIPERTVEYLREVREELLKVAWPGRTEVANWTVVVFIMVVLVTALVFGLDYAFAKGVIFLFGK
jgi:preprotein translocase subunit SecE